MRSAWTWLKAGMPTKEAVRDQAMLGVMVALVLFALLIPAQLAIWGRIHFGPSLGIVSDKPPVDVEKADDTPPVFATGWIPRPDAVAEVSAGLNFKHFSDTPAGKATADQDTDAFLWQAFVKTNKVLPEARNQSSIGSCVSFGTTAAVDTLIAISCTLGTSGEYHDTVQEAVYGGSRVQIGGGRLGSGDGSVGAWAAKWVKEYGVIARGKVGAYDLSTYSVARCRQWGNSGCPKDLLEVARQHPVKAISQVGSAESARKALLSGYPIAVSSNQGFTSTRDANGFARASGNWGHCMAVIGYRSDKKGFFVWNSWGADWIKGPKGAGDPPEGGFWADWNTIDGMCRQGDTWAFSDVSGFGKRRLNWFVHNRPNRRPNGGDDLLVRFAGPLFSPSLRRAYHASDSLN